MMTPVMDKTRWATPTGKVWHYDLNCRGFTLYSIKYDVDHPANEIALRPLRPCKKCVKTGG